MFQINNNKIINPYINNFPYYPISVTDSAQSEPRLLAQIILYVSVSEGHLYSYKLHKKLQTTPC